MGECECKESRDERGKVEKLIPELFSPRKRRINPYLCIWILQHSKLTKSHRDERLNPPCASELGNLTMECTKISSAGVPRLSDMCKLKSR
ncbi:hypothetical protein I7I50_06063 [Histoplasma capsulatum G186AR]|uniref:Uncharacterized protein n=1 Tax=Ajellomyces capsulatus TaxID=5037 RepID=A0A8H7Z093_AJECA|nr:hypothetical protein I7I52_08801 [Histoplasma capsulatum]QSS67082.1 hypothetical protein I7I50_06063 [Histoplasma capsulatum G186AR]